MGAKKKWFKTLFCLKTTGKSNSLEKDDNKIGVNGQNSGSISNIWDQREHSNIHSGFPGSMLDRNVVTEIRNAEDTYLQSITKSASWSSTSIQVQNSAHFEQNTRENLDVLHFQAAFGEFLNSGSKGSIWDYAKCPVENELIQNITRSASLPSTSVQEGDAGQHQQNEREELAAIHIQAAFRGFLARQALDALKGLVRLQALFRGHAVRKKAANAQHSLRALGKGQKRHRMVLLDQTSQEKPQGQVYHKVHAKGLEDGWCDTLGSVDKIQAKQLKKMEAVARREKLKAYALAHRGHGVPGWTLEHDKSYWGRDWRGKPNTAGRKPKINARDCKLVRSLRNSSDEKDCPCRHDGYIPSPDMSLYMPKKSPTTGPGQSPKPILAGNAAPRPNILQRSRSTPKERRPLVDEQGSGRSSLPNSRLSLSLSYVLTRLDMPEEGDGCSTCQATW